MTRLLYEAILWQLKFKGFKMSKKNIYLTLAILGILLPYSLFLPWLLEHGLDFSLFFTELFVNDVAGTGGLDILAVTLAIVTFIVLESKKLGMKHIYIPILATLVGVGFGLSLFLYIREKHYEKESN
jgi:hypothetical protein